MSSYVGFAESTQHFWWVCWIPMLGILSWLVWEGKVNSIGPVSLPAIDLGHLKHFWMLAIVVRNFVSARNFVEVPMSQKGALTVRNTKKMPKMPYSSTAQLRLMGVHLPDFCGEQNPHLLDRVHPSTTQCLSNLR